MTLTAGDKGEWAKAVVTAALLKAGVPVYRAASPATTVQLIAEDRGVGLLKLEVRSAQHKPTKDDPDRLALVQQPETDLFDALAVVTPGGEALFHDGPWSRAAGLVTFRLDGATIRPVPRTLLEVLAPEPSEIRLDPAGLDRR